MHTSTLSLLFAASMAAAQGTPGYAQGSNLVSSGGSFGSALGKVDKVVRLDGDARNEDEACDKASAVASDEYEEWNGDDGVNFCGYEVCQIPLLSRTRTPCISFAKIYQRAKLFQSSS